MREDITPNETDAVGERLAVILEQLGLEIHRCRPQCEQCWFNIHIQDNKRSKHSRKTLTVHHDKLSFATKSYSPGFHAEIRIDPNTIQMLADNCVSVGDNKAFINIVGPSLKGGVE
jgi:hypothetical protein